MRILVCIKRVPLTGGKMSLAADERALETSHLGFTIGPHEECAVEEAVRLVEANGGESVVLTLGPADALAQLRDAMALGVDRAIHLQTEGGEWDAQATAEAVLEAVRADEAAAGPFDLILFGNESADAGGYQVGLRVAYALGRPAVRGAKGIAVGAGGVRVEQATKSGRDVYDVPLPAVVTTLEGLNLPRYPSVPGRLRAKSKPVEVRTPTPPTPRLELVRLAVPAGARKQAEVLGTGPDAADRVVAVMKELGVLS